MIRSQHDYDEIYQARTWAYGDRPDPELIRALEGKTRGAAVDLGGGQGRHALALAALGFDVALVDTAKSGLHQAAQEAEERGLHLKIVQQDCKMYAPEGSLQLAVAALFFHVPAERTSLEAAKRIGEGLETEGMLYLSLPGYTNETHEFASRLLRAAGCEQKWVTKKLVTKKDRPRLPVPRRNETRALGIKV